MELFNLPNWLCKHTFTYDPRKLSDEIVDSIKFKLKRYHDQEPLVSIVIPAFNEEAGILNTLSSLADLETAYRVELIVVNNNSTDKTKAILDACGVKTILAKDQGISYARQAGLDAAKGKIILNADSDSIYPKNWVDQMVKPLLKSKAISCVYGSYSFIPSDGNSRMSLAMYEVVAESFFKIKKVYRECVNVMGFTFAFRREDAIAVGGYNHFLNRTITGRSEDGWMAFQLLKVGKLYKVESAAARVWTSDRRLMADGSLSNAFKRRVKRELSRLHIYLDQRYEIK